MTTQPTEETYLRTQKRKTPLLAVRRGSARDSACRHERRRGVADDPVLHAGGRVRAHRRQRKR